MISRYAKILLALVALSVVHPSKLPAATGPTPSNFFTTQTSLGDAGNGYSAYYLSYFNIYLYPSSEGATPTYLYKDKFGFLYFLGPSGGSTSSDEAYFYDFTTKDYFYTSVSLYPYFYSFNLGSFLYYFESSNPREFYEFKTSSFIFY